MGEVEKALAIKMNSLRDLVRLAASLSSPPHIVIYIWKFKLDDNRVVLGVMAIHRDYYKYYGLPIFYYYIVEGEEAETIWNSNYIIISTSDEGIRFSKTPKPALSIPLIGLAEKPPMIPDLG